MSTAVDSGSLIADGTVQSLSAPTVAGVYRVVVDLGAMASGDGVSMVAKMKVLSGGTVRKTFDEAFVDTQVGDNILRHSLFVIAPQGCEFTLEQTAGVNRSYPFWVDKLADVVVVADGTKTLDGTQQTLVVATDNDELSLLTDHALQVGGDTVVVNLFSSVLPGGTTRVVEQLALTGSQSDPDVIRQSIPYPSPHTFSPTLHLTTGVNHNVPWALCRIT